MTKTIQCPSCAREYPADPKLGGKKVRCQNCGQEFAVSVKSVTPELEDAAPLTAALAPSHGDDLFDAIASAADETAGESAAWETGSPLSTPKPARRGRRKKTARAAQGFSGLGVFGRNMAATGVLCCAVANGFMLCSQDWKYSTVAGLAASVVGIVIGLLGLLPLSFGAPTGASGGSKKPRRHISWGGLIVASFCVVSVLVVSGGFVIGFKPVVILLSIISWMIILTVITGVIYGFVCLARFVGIFRSITWGYLAATLVLVVVLGNSGGFGTGNGSMSATPTSPEGPNPVEIPKANLPPKWQDEEESDKKDSPAERDRDVPKEGRRERLAKRAAASRNAASPSEEPQEEQPVRPEPEAESVEQSSFRTWSDSTGSFEIEAALVDSHDGKVTLLRRDGRTVDVPLKRLCEADQAYVAGTKQAESGAADIAAVDEETDPITDETTIRMPNGDPEDTRMAGGDEGWEFRHEDEKPLLGITYGLGGWAGEKTVGIIKPVFDRQATGSSQSAVIAKPGYAVGALEVDAKRFVNAMQIVFMRLNSDGSLDPSEGYTSE